MKIKQRKTKHPAAYDLVTEDGDVWYCFQFAYEGLINRGDRKDVPTWYWDHRREIDLYDFWHLMRPDGKWEKSFTHLSKAKQYLAEKLGGQAK
ncbi:hypothetical protein FDA94_28875 [Herbidospora galbida]|uniref:Uncharacterized protein n=1 Tax=Herbidospora galbida TaxID=2575442 RepID=A0A4U3MAP1_9ACTN|nr:hypothetical protein [Herbidospora galbida]TKK84646.1 hypothetical protein FDA94_28875 [Herbidospora galbida]